MCLIKAKFWKTNTFLWGSPWCQRLDARTLCFDLVGYHNNVKVMLRPASKDFGLRAGRNVRVSVGFFSLGWILLSVDKILYLSLSRQGPYLSIRMLAITTHSLSLLWVAFSVTVCFSANPYLRRHCGRIRDFVGRSKSVQHSIGNFRCACQTQGG